MLCPSDYSLIIFGLWRMKSRTSSKDNSMIHTPKERPDLVLQTLLNKSVKVRPKYRTKITRTHFCRHPICYITIIHTPKERPDLDLQTLVNKFFKIRPNKGLLGQKPQTRIP